MFFTFFVLKNKVLNLQNKFSKHLKVMVSKCCEPYCLHIIYMLVDDKGAKLIVTCIFQTMSLYPGLAWLIQKHKCLHDLQLTLPEHPCTCIDKTWTRYWNHTWIDAFYVTFVYIIYYVQCKSIEG